MKKTRILLTSLPSERLGLCLNLREGPVVLRGVAAGEHSVNISLNVCVQTINP